VEAGILHSDFRQMAAQPEQSGRPASQKGAQPAKKHIELGNNRIL
jgi:hypothetical protein